jgi:uncharacterized protein
MRVIRSAEWRRMSRKNGGGETTEIAVSPAGAKLAFDWRISVVRVASDGPSSRFPGIDRTLTILDRSGIRLAIDGCAPVDLTADSHPVPFPGDVPAAASLIGSPVTDPQHHDEARRVWIRSTLCSSEVTRADFGKRSLLARRW